MEWFRKQVVLIVLIVALVVSGVASATIAAAMPARVMIIRHAEKSEDPRSLHLTARGWTRAMALVQFFQSDPRVLERGTLAAIVAQMPSRNKNSVRCRETVEPLARALGLTLVDRFPYGEVDSLVDWLRSARVLDAKAVLICAEHLGIVPIAKALGVTDPGLPYWPHETYDRVWIIDLAPDGAVTSFRDIPQQLLFGDSFQEVSKPGQIGSLRFSQTVLETTTGAPHPKRSWNARISAEMPGDFSTFDEDTVPILRLGGYTFGYHATTLGTLRTMPNVEMTTDQAAGTGTMCYQYRMTLDGREVTCARVTFSWDRHRLKAEFLADVGHPELVQELNMPVTGLQGKPEGVLDGAVSAILGFGPRRFHAPAGLGVRGQGTRQTEASGQTTYRIDLSGEDGRLVARPAFEEAMRSAESVRGERRP